MSQAGYGPDGNQNKTLEEIKFSIENLQSLPKEVGDFLKSVQFMSSNFEKLRMDVLEIKRENQYLRNGNITLTKRMDFLQRQLEDLDQYGRRQNFEIHGLPISDNENTEKLALKVLQKIDENISLSDRDVAHRIGRQKDDKGKIKKTRPIIVRFTTRKVRNKIYKNKKNVCSFTTKDLGFETANYT